MKEEITPEKADKLSDFTVNLGLFYNIVLALFKTVFGIIGHSTALLADGIMSTSDVVYYIAVKICLKMANKPADEEHPFGHKQMELIASIVIAAFIITTAITIAWTSIDTFFDLYAGEAEASKVSIFTLLAFYIAIFAFVSKIILATYTQYIGNKTKNPAIKALATDHLNDIFSAVAVIVGIAFTVVFHIPWVDPIAGVLVSFFILRTGIEILKDAANGLMDISPNEEMQGLVAQAIDTFPEEIKIESILSHRYGNFYSLNITIGITPEMSISQADNLADNIEKRLLEMDTYLKYVFIHYHPKKEG
jgi:cation diffusion facilitator family transporter